MRIRGVSRSDTGSNTDTVKVRSWMKVSDERGTARVSGARTFVDTKIHNFKPGFANTANPFWKLDNSITQKRKLFVSGKTLTTCFQLEDFYSHKVRIGTPTMCENVETSDTLISWMEERDRIEIERERERERKINPNMFRAFARSTRLLFHSLFLIFLSFSITSFSISFSFTSFSIT